MPPPALRPARYDDAATVLALSEIAGHGFLPHFFAQSLPAHQTLQDYMLARVRDPASKMSYTKCWLAELKGQPVGMVNLDPIPDPADPIDPQTPAMFRPLAELEAQAPGTTVIEFLATLPQARGKGVATALLDRAHQLRGPRGLSLVVSDNNTAARALYKRAGFAEIDRRPIVKDGWASDGTDWILMIRP